MSETRSVETTGPDIEEAIEAGLKALDVARENVIVEVLDEPSRGLLGIGARMARVRLTTAVQPRSARQSPQTPASSSPSSVTVAEDKGFEARAQSARQTVGVDEGDHDEAVEEEVQMGAATLRELLQHMRVNAEVSIERTLGNPEEVEDESPWVLHIHGENLGLLIGHRGKTLSALQYLTRLIASRDLQHRAAFIVDVENYKARRQVLLRRLAQRVAQDAIRRRRTIEMEPMPPHERRIIHLALRNHAQVYTQSVGEGEHRRVTVIPKR
jgi:spoIIIJ-associated protein